MATKIKYKGNVIAEIQSGQTAELDCSGFKMGSDVVVEVNSNLQEKTITENGEYSASTDGAEGYSKVTVDVPIPDGYIQPSGDFQITENGTKDVTNYASVTVDVPIPDGYIVPSGDLEITENGTKDVTNYASVTVDIEPTLQEKTVTENGEVTPDEGYEGLSKVTIDVPIPDGYIQPSGDLEITDNGTKDVTNYASVTVDVEPTLQEKTVTPSSNEQNVTADEGYDGLSKVTVASIPAEYIIPEGSVTITENLTVNVTDKAEVVVNVPIPDGYIVPSGNLPITENGTFNVTDKESVTVNITGTEPEKWDGSYTIVRQLISFTISTTEDESLSTHYSEENMTWEQWIASEYNTFGLTIGTDSDKSVVYYPYQDSNYVLQYNGTQITPTDVIIAGYNYEINTATLISFTISTTEGESLSTNQAEEGMTWEQWIASEYNTSGLTIGTESGNSVVYYSYQDTNYVLQYDGAQITPTDTIVSNRNYEIDIVNIIVFTVRTSDGTLLKTYQADEGMTWEQWIASDHSTTGVTIGTDSGNSVVYYSYQDTNYVLQYNGTQITPTDTIVANRSYKIDNSTDTGDTTEPISFTISIFNGAVLSTYQADDGMTWNQWIASEYNTSGVTTGTDSGKSVVYYSYQGTNYILQYNGTQITPTDTIVANRSYVINTADLISFTVKLYDETGEIETISTYQAEEGMTWDQWIESDYNTVGMTIGTDTTGGSTVVFYPYGNDDTYPYTKYNYILQYSGNLYVDHTAEIIADYNYHIVAS